MGRGLRSAYSSCHGCPSSWAMRLMAVALSNEGTCSQQKAHSIGVGLHKKQALHKFTPAGQSDSGGTESAGHLSATPMEGWATKQPVLLQRQPESGKPTLPSCQS